MLNTFLSWRRRRWTAEISTERSDVSPVTTGGFATVDVREVLRHALRQLTAKQRAVIALRYFEDRSETETAAIMGCTVGTVKSQASRAIAKQCHVVKGSGVGSSWLRRRGEAAWKRDPW
jgi:RNA polymerase sigma factor (sigma-70 family)